MAAKRHHTSKKARHAEHMGMERYERGSVRGSKELTHHRDEFNDEKVHERDGYKMSSYHYDRERREDSSRYEGYSGRRRQELMDAGMIHEDHREIANLPQNVMIKPYPKTGPYMPEDLDDTIRGVDNQMDYDDSQRAKHFYPKKV